MPAARHPAARTRAPPAHLAQRRARARLPIGTDRRRGSVPPVRVRVTLSAKLEGKALSSLPLFVLVRDPRAAGPPLAVKRLKATFPQTVELTTQDSMLPGHSFTKGQLVEVVARVSKSGNPVESAGDLFGLCGPQSGRGRRSRHSSRTRLALKTDLGADTRALMSSPYSLSFGSQPSILPSYARIVFGRKQPIVPDGLKIPRLEAELTAYRPSRSRVEAYRAVCGGPPSDYLPPAYPHVIATPIQLALLSSLAFPVRLMGLVHLRNHIEHYRPIHVDETLALRTHVDGRRDTDRGQEFDVHTTVLADGKPAWYEVCVFMARRPRTRHLETVRRAHQRGRRGARTGRGSRAALGAGRDRQTSADSGQRRRLALCAHLQRLQPDSSLGFRRAHVRLQSGHRARHVVDGALAQRVAAGHVRRPVPRGRGVQAPRDDSRAANAQRPGARQQVMVSR